MSAATRGAKDEQFDIHALAPGFEPRTSGTAAGFPNHCIIWSAIKKGINNIRFETREKVTHQKDVIESNEIYRLKWLFGAVDLMS